MTVHRVNAWEEFKALAIEMHPVNMFYLAEPHLFSNPPIGLRLTFYHEQDMYVFTDHPDGPRLVKTGVPITNHTDKIQVEILEKDIHKFISNNFPWVEPVSLPPFIY
jgi:hypothetical protein